MKKRRGGTNLKSLVFLILFTFFIVLVSAAIGWNTEAVSTVYNGSEDNLYIHNFTLNLTTTENLSSFSINTVEATEWNFTWNGMDIALANISDWIFFNYSVLGNFIINSTLDNQTGGFEIPIQILSTEGGEQTRSFTFNVSPVNDVPYFTNIKSNYTFPANASLNSSEKLETYNVSVYDEEIEEGTGNPLNFSYEIIGCSIAEWLNDSGDANCSEMLSGLTFSLLEDSNNTALFDYSYNESEIGTYSLNITVQDNTSCQNLEDMYNNSACTPDYEVSNLIFNESITLIVESSLKINITGCEGLFFYENESDAYCNITIRTRYENDLLNLSSQAHFSNYSATPTNSSWFYGNNPDSSSNYQLVVPILVNTSKPHVGNWTINFSVEDITSGEDPMTESFNISIFRNESLADFPQISPIENQTFSTSKKDTIFFNITDEDFTIEDKSVYNETINFTLEIQNISNLSQEIDEDSFFDILSVDRASLAQNYQNFTITFTPNKTHVGNYSVNISFSDRDGNTNSTIFNMTIYPNEFPQWNETTYEYNFTVNSTQETTTENITNWDLTNQSLFAFDEDGDILTFSNSTGAPPNFNLTSDGILNFQPWKTDVGYWEFNITANDGNLENSSIWKVNVSNINSAPEINESSFLVKSNGTGCSSLECDISENNAVDISFSVVDYDLLATHIVETLNISNITTTCEENLTLEISFSEKECINESCSFETTFIPQYPNVGGNCTTFVEVVDSELESANFSFNLSISDVNTPPVINITNLSTSILDGNFTYEINATDTRDGTNLTYEIENLSEGSPPLELNSTTGVISFDFKNNPSYSGEWSYQLNVTDKGIDGNGTDSSFTLANFTLFVHGYPNITEPVNSTILNLSEGSIEQLEFNLTYAVNNTNLTYNIYLDKILSFGNSTYNYTNQSLINSFNFTYLSGENLTINFTPDYDDETYNLTKNFTLEVVNLDYPALSYNETWPTNISHRNQNISFHTNITSENQNLTKIVNNPIEINLSEHFEDVDAFDEEYNQKINFTVRKAGGNRSDLTDNANVNESTWVFSLTSSSAISELIEITAFEWDNGALLKNVTSNNFTVTFLDDDTGSDDRPSSGGSSSTTKTEHYALKIITPDNVKISDENFIIVNFSLLNPGQVKLSGIDLSGLVDLSGITTEDLRITFSQDYVDSLAVGEQKNYSMRIDVNTGAVGKYDITIFGNVTSPKFTDWATFSVEVLAVDESKLSQLLIFTEKLVSENPECLELREFFNEAKNLFDSGSLIESNVLVNQVITACQESISRNEQIKNNETEIRTTLIYVLVATVSILLVGFVYYTIRKIRFNKLKTKEYI